MKILQHCTVWNIREVNEFAFPINRKIRIIPPIHPSIKHDVIFQSTKRLLIYWVSTTEYWHFVTQDFWRAEVGWDFFRCLIGWLVFDIKTFVQIYQKRGREVRAAIIDTCCWPLRVINQEMDNKGILGRKSRWRILIVFPEKCFGMFKDFSKWRSLLA